MQHRSSACVAHHRGQLPIEVKRRSGSRYEARTAGLERSTVQVRIHGPFESGPYSGTVSLVVGTNCMTGSEGVAC